VISQHQRKKNNRTRRNDVKLAHFIFTINFETLVYLTVEIDAASERTSAIPYDASGPLLELVLESLDLVEDVQVAFSKPDTATRIWDVSFLFRTGKMPVMHVEYEWATASIFCSAARLVASNYIEGDFSLSVCDFSKALAGFEHGSAVVTTSQNWSTELRASSIVRSARLETFTVVSVSPSQLVLDASISTTSESTSESTTF
jgi:hypothetical protein